VRLALAVAASAALALPAAAAAHATLRATTPADGAVLAQPPRTVTVRFDDVVRVGSGNAAVDNATGRSVLAHAAARGDVLTLTLRPRLAHGAYSVRWGIVSDDGHLERGVLAFAVGAGSPRPRSILGAAVPLTWSDIALRSLYYLGLLTAGGAAIFGLAVREAVGRALLRPLAQLLFFGLLAAFVGGSGIVHTAAPGTRYVLVVEAALGLAVAGGAAAALAPARPALVVPAGAASLALLAAPTLAGHALDPAEPRWLAAPVDVLHLTAAAAWLGALLGLAWVLPRAGRLADGSKRASALALGAVVVLGVTGIVRAATSLSAVSQAWSTAYGRTLLVKTVLFALLLAAGYVNRRRLVLVRAELLLLAAVVVAVAVLTELRPGRGYSAPSAPAVVSPSRAG